MSDIINEELEYKVIQSNLGDIQREVEEYNKSAHYYAKKKTPTSATSEIGQITEKETGMPIAVVFRSKSRYGGPYMHHFNWHPDFIKAHPGVMKSDLNRFDINKGASKIKSKSDAQNHVHQMLETTHHFNYRDPIGAKRNEDDSLSLFHVDTGNHLGDIKKVKQGYSDVQTYFPSEYVKSNLTDLQIKSVGHPGNEENIHAHAMKVMKELSSSKPYAVGSHSSGDMSRHSAFVSNLSPEDLSAEHEKTLKNDGHEITRTSPITFEARKKDSNDTILSHAIGSKLHVHSFREEPEEYLTGPNNLMLKNS